MILINDEKRKVNDTFARLNEFWHSFVIIFNNKSHNKILYYLKYNFNKMIRTSKANIMNVNETNVTLLIYFLLLFIYVWLKEEQQYRGIIKHGFWWYEIVLHCFELTAILLLHVGLTVTFSVSGLISIFNG